VRAEVSQPAREPRASGAKWLKGRRRSGGVGSTVPYHSGYPAGPRG
jgi:hypothetical protein